MIPKFRAWGRDSNYPGTESEKFEMFYDVSVVTTFNDKKQHIIANFGMYNEAEYNGTEILDYQLMQSTGLKDKNGVEIFEGDVINDKNYGRKNLVCEYSLFSAGFRLEPCKGILGIGLYQDETDFLEVIGNIYENPEFLESVEE